MEEKGSAELLFPSSLPLPITGEPKIVPNNFCVELVPA
jgi:hypothetical protein